MSRRLAVIAAGLLAASGGAAQQPLKDRPGYTDPALFARMPGYFLSGPGSFTEAQFDGHEF
jgi:hypothetical protein